MILRRGERLSHARGEIQEGHIDREWDEAEAALDALLEENATLRATKDRVDEECVLYGLTHSDGEAYGIEGLLKHIYANRDITIGMERHLADLLKEKMEAAEALVVSLTEQRDEIALDRQAWHDRGHDINLLNRKLRGEVAQLREALSEIDLETTAGGLPFDKLVEIGRMARAALAAGVPSTPPDQDYECERCGQINTVCDECQGVQSEDRESPDGSVAEVVLRVTFPDSASDVLHANKMAHSLARLVEENLDQRSTVSIEEIRSAGDARVTAKEASDEE